MSTGARAASFEGACRAGSDQQPHDGAGGGLGGGTSLQQGASGSRSHGTTRVVPERRVSRQWTPVYGPTTHGIVSATLRMRRMYWPG